MHNHFELPPRACLACNLRLVESVTLSPSHLVTPSLYGRARAKEALLEPNNVYPQPLSVDDNPKQPAAPLSLDRNAPCPICHLPFAICHCVQSPLQNDPLARRGLDALPTEATLAEVTAQDSGALPAPRASSLLGPEPEPCQNQPQDNQNDRLPGQSFTPSPPHPLTHSQKKIALHRQTLLAQYDHLLSLDPHLSINQATHLLHLRGNALWKLIQLRDRAIAASPARTCTLADLAPALSPGRKVQTSTHASIATWALAQPAFCEALKTLYQATIGSAHDSSAHGRRTGSVTTALLRLAEEEVCPPELSLRLRQGEQPKPLVAFLRQTYTPEIEQRIRGEKHYQLYGLNSRRDDTLRLPDGSRIPNRSGRIVEFDDMSANQPFWVRCPDGSYILSRQGLYARDVHSKRWLGVELIAMPHEAYTAATILRFVRRLMTDYGKFEILRFEHGIWHARAIAGYKITPSPTHPLIDEFYYERPAMPEEEMTALQSGLEAIGVTIDWANSAHAKIIENGFNYFQTILATYTTDFLNIGRHAGEFETAAKRLRQARNGREPGDLGFAPMDTLADRISEKAFPFINRIPGTRCGQQIIPDQVWESDIASFPLDPLCEKDLAAFFPEMREAVIRGGKITCQVDGVHHDFRADTLVELGHGYRVYIRFDTSEPTLGVAIYNRETSSANYRNYKDGQFICYARWEMPAPQYTVSENSPLARQFSNDSTIQRFNDSTDQGKAFRKSQDKFVRTAYRSLPRVGKPPVKTAECRDGAGALQRLEQNTSSAGFQPAVSQASSLKAARKEAPDWQTRRAAISAHAAALAAVK